MKVPLGNNAAEKDPAPLLTKIFREINGVYTASSRIAIPDDKVYNLVNIIPIGPQNAEVVDNISHVLFDYSSDPPYAARNVNLNNIEYLVIFSTSGRVHLWDIANQNDTVINNGNLLSGANSRCDQWKNDTILFIDQNGYYSYDGSSFQKISGPGVPATGEDIAVFGSRVWIVNGRLLVNSGANDFSAASFLPVNGAAFNSLTDPQIRSKIRRLMVSSGSLYLIADTSVNIVYNLQVPNAANGDPTPSYQNDNIQGAVGSDQPFSVFPFTNSSLLMANRYGAYQIYGVQCPKISDDINGTWQYIDPTVPISGGAVTIKGILCGAFLFTRKNDPVFGNGTIIAIFTQRAAPSSIQSGEAVWFFCDFGAITFLVSAFLNGVSTLYCFRNNQLFQLFADTSTAPTAEVMTKLWPMEDELAAKEVIIAGFSAVYRILGTQISLTVDTPADSFDTGITVNVNSGTWVNAVGHTGQWQNAAGTIGGWFTPGPYLASGNAPATGSRNVGLTLISTGYSYELNLMAMDYKIRQRWLTTG